MVMQKSKERTEGEKVEELCLPSNRNDNENLFDFVGFALFFFLGMA